MTAQWFGLPTRRLLRCGDFTSRDDLETQITAFTIRHNKHARLYQWSYDADADHARYIERHPPGPALPRPPASRVTVTIGDQEPVRDLRCAALAQVELSSPDAGGECFPFFGGEY